MSSVETDLIHEFLTEIGNVCKNLGKYATPDAKEQGFLEKIEVFEDRHHNFVVLSHDEVCNEEMCTIKVRANIAGAAYNIKMLCLEPERRLIASIWKLVNNFIL